MTKSAKLFKNCVLKTFISKCLKKVIALLILLLGIFKADTYAQFIPSGVINSTVSAGEYYHPVSLTLKPGFSFAASPGNSFRAFNAPGPDCQLLNTQPSNSKNYIITYIPRKAGISNPAATDLTNCDVMQTVQYFDGLGRPSQTIQVKASPTGLDVVQPIEYDAYGRESKKYLPYSHYGGTPGQFRPDAISEQSTFYQQTGNGHVITPFAFSQTVFEPSPVARTLESGAPGNDWQPLGTPGTSGNAGHTTKLAYSTNAAGEVKLWLYNMNGNGCTLSGDYNPSELNKLTSIDEQGNQSIEFKDKMGKVICKKVQKSISEFLSTYYIYDNYGNLAYVIPPIPSTQYPGSFIEQDNVFDRYMYGYHYDDRNRLNERKIPGKGWEFMVYNTLDQLVMSQDAEQRNKPQQQWTFIKYDIQGRVVMTGLWIDGTRPGTSNADNSGRIWLSEYYITTSEPKWETRDNSNLVTGYSNLSTPGGTGYTYLTINYYDDYEFPGKPSSYNTSTTGLGSDPTGLLTGTRVNILNADGSYGQTADMLWTINYFDDIGQVKESYLQNHAGGYDHILNEYNFNNQPTQIVRIHNTTNVQNLYIATYYTYDHMGRKIDTRMNIYNGTGGVPQPVVLSRLQYNEIGQLLGKKLHSGNQGAGFLQNIGFAYNERGWLTSSAGELFAMQLQYNTGQGAMWNGNIASQHWGTPGNLSKHYEYSYDTLNRLTAGNSNTGYNENGIEYDDLGNIQQLFRSGGTNSGAYTYHYDGNRLLSVDNLTGSNYNYDLNGNMLHDGRINADVYYNLLNLPRNIPAKSLSYTYNAIGNKLNKNNGSISTDYISGIQYDNGQLIFIQTEEGRALKNGNDWNFEYTLSDHLGNNRINFDTGGGVANLRQSTDYYPFGLEITAPITPSQKNQYLYNGKEKQEETTTYDYGARFYDPIIARWTAIDLKAEIYHEESVYDYVKNNPLRFVDPNGMEIKDPDGIVKEQKKYLDDNIGYINSALKKDGLSDAMKEALTSFSEALSASLKEINALEKSDQVYAVSYQPGSEGGLNYDLKTGEIKVGISREGTVGLKGHELNHAFQYETGKLSLQVNNAGYGTLYDISDETTSYNRERILMLGVGFFINSKLQWDDEATKAVGKTLTPPAYQSLPTGPIDISSKQGKLLRERTSAAGHNGQSVTEVYKGWQKDYGKGTKK